MKFRNGFVSNSSSSSFIVAFDKFPASAEEMQLLLFETEDVIPSPWEHFKETLETEKAAAIIFQSLKKIKPSQGEKIVNSGYHDWYPELDEEAYSDDKKWQGHIAYAGQRGKELWQKFSSDNKNKVFYTVEFSDNDGPVYELLEHAGVFKRLPHLQISHH